MTHLYAAVLPKRDLQGSWECRLPCCTVVHSFRKPSGTLGLGIAGKCRIDLNVMARSRDLDEILRVCREKDWFAREISA